MGKVLLLPADGEDGLEAIVTFRGGGGRWRRGGKPYGQE